MFNILNTLISLYVHFYKLIWQDSIIINIQLLSATTLYFTGILPSLLAILSWE